MSKSRIIYEEKGELTAKYYRLHSDDFLNYKTQIRIKEIGNNPIEMILEFDGNYPFAAPLPPEQHIIKASSILDLYIKISRWFKKYGYELQ